MEDPFWFNLLNTSSEDCNYKVLDTEKNNQ